MPTEFIFIVSRDKQIWKYWFEKSLAGDDISFESKIDSNAQNYFVDRKLQSKLIIY